MATSIPPHNVGELIDALLHLLEHPERHDRRAGRDRPGPGLPHRRRHRRAARSILEAYETGRGGVRLRARWEKEDPGRGIWQIVVTEMPYQVQKSKLVERLADLIEDKKAPLLGDVRDESAEDVRLVLEPKSRTVEPDVLMESLFKLSELEIRFPLNMNVLTPRARAAA